MSKFELSIDNPMLKQAKTALNACLNAMVCQAVKTGSMEGTATLKISMEIVDAMDEITAEMKKIPEIKYKAAFSVPIKHSVDGKVTEHSSLQRDPEGGWLLVNGQISMDELMEDESET